MAYQIDRRTFILYETVEMLYKYVNGISFCDIAESMARLYGDAFPAAFTQRLQCLERISREGCAVRDVQNPTVQRYFRRFETDAVRDNMCLAKAMTLAFYLYEAPEPEEEVRHLKERWRCMQRQGFRLGDMSISGLEFRPLEPGQERRSLVDLLYGLNYPAEYRLELLQTLSHYGQALDALLELAAPYARQLEAQLEGESWLLESTADYWQTQFTGTSPSQLVQLIAQSQETLPELPDKRVLFSLMNCTGILYDLNDEYSAVSRGGSTFVIGCAVTIHSTIRKVGGSVERTCAILRSISDRSKFEVLQRLGAERSYGQKLAEEMEINPGQMSRILVTLFNYGFLTREQEQSRYYYTTNKESISAFFRQAQQLLTGRAEQ